MRRITTFGWVLIAAVVVTVVLNVVAPDIGALRRHRARARRCAAVADGMGTTMNWFDVDVAR